MKKRKVTKASKRRLLLFGVISIFIFVYFFMSLSYYFVKIKDLHKEKKSLEKELVTLEEKEEKLKTEIDKLKDSDYVARYARENYLYSKDGEYIIKIDPKEKEEEEEEEDNSKYYTYSLIAAGTVTGIIILYMFVRVIKRK